MKRLLAHDISETGILPDPVLRQGIRRLLKQRLNEIAAGDIERGNEAQATLFSEMCNTAIAVKTDKANEQHYEVPAAFYQQVLGPRLKYSCSEWNENTTSLHQAEIQALKSTCERAGLEDGMNILELGCGWGSLTLWMAEQYPRSHITAVSNSQSQGEFIRDQLDLMGLENVTVVTADMNEFTTNGIFDRVVSVEMFEHMRNWKMLFSRVADWLAPDGQFFMHIFVHRSTPYLFEVRDPSDWMSRWFFSGGMMPSADLPLMFQQKLQFERRWIWNGQHYKKTCDAWLRRMDINRDKLWPVFEQTYGKDFAKIWWMRWRLFFLACGELFAYNQGQEWFVGHYLFSKKPQES